jgi:2-polyprenyl-3-methyl-5-hydroxy-6-metoxy-1,4-benzoquinol methylase
MTITEDPEGTETSILYEMVDFKDLEVLEIGCGEGRLTWRYVEKAAHVTAIEDEREFDFNIHAGNLGELQQLLAKEWETAILPDETVERVQDIFRRVNQECEVVLRVPTRMTKLRIA